ncbi:MAG: polysaccharide biosynthesis protein [Bacteroidetes bacterium]|nr:polysaccharide biosynthesis protein [Bacteroidota bacterium]MBP6314444.1 polysaccharide biosynthesis protein [Chitinophagaceae bacterium]
MNHLFNLEEFVKQHITFRPHSLLEGDLQNNHQQLSAQVYKKSVLVIGGAGSIGSSYIKSILRYKPSRLFVVDINENALTELTRALRSDISIEMPAEYITYPLNFNDPIFYKILAKFGPFEIVANFAAHKHVRSEKDIFSIEAMVQNNVIHAEKLLEVLSKDKNIEHFFAVSTDKAANPVSIMGASKKLMEDVLMSYSAVLPITTARFANVAFSNGSLLQGFIERLMKKQPLSSPNNIRRYFVSPAESGQICMLSCLLGASSDIFFPKLDPNTELKTFSDIAIKFLDFHGLKPIYTSSEEEAKSIAQNLSDTSNEYPVYFFESETSGEKSYEEFYTEQEQLDWDSFINLGIIKNTPKPPIEKIKTIIDKLNLSFQKKDLTKSDLVGVINEYIPNFSHIETGKNLDQKM